LNFDLYLSTAHLYFNQILKKEWVSFAKISLYHQGTHLHNGIKKTKDTKILKNLNIYITTVAWKNVPEKLLLLPMNPDKHI